MKRRLSAFLAFALIVSLLVPVGFAAAEDIEFSDLDNVAAADRVYIETLVKAGVISGYKNEDGTYSFKPYDNVKRAQMAKIIAKSMGWEPNVEAAKKFNDVANVPEEDLGWIGALAERNVTTGYPNGGFGPYDEVSRQQLATFIIRALGLEDLAKELYEDGTIKLSFTDASSIDDAHKANVALAAKLGILSGRPDGSFAPNANAYRVNTAKLAAPLVDEDTRNELVDKAEGLRSNVLEKVDAANDSVTIDGKEYTVAASAALSVNGLYVANDVGAGQLALNVFQVDKKVQFTTNNAATPQIVILKAEYDAVDGIVEETGIDANGRYVIVDGDKTNFATTWYYVDGSGTVSVGNFAADIAQGRAYTFIVNDSGKVVTAFANEANVVSGNVTATGVNVDGDSYIVVDGKRYVLASSIGTANITLNDTVVAGGTPADQLTSIGNYLTAGAKIVGKVTLNAKGEATVVDLWYQVVRGTFTNAASGNSDIGLDVDNDNTSDWFVNTSLTTFTDIDPATVKSNVVITLDGKTKDSNGNNNDLGDLNAYLSDPKNANAFVQLVFNADGEITEITVNVAHVQGVVTSTRVVNPAGTANDKYYITVAGTEYELTGQAITEFFDPDANGTPQATNGFHDEVADGEVVVVYGVLNLDGKIARFEAAPNSGSTATPAVAHLKEAVVVATPTEKGTDGAGNESFANGGTIRVMDELGNVYEIDVTDGAGALEARIIKGTETVSFNTIKKGNIVDIVLAGAPNPAATNDAQYLIIR